MNQPGQKLKLQALRGAITAESNTVQSIEFAGSELVTELINRNPLKADQIIAIIFSVAKDLNACFPASVARKQKGWEKIALLDCQQMFVESDLKNCIRILAHVMLPPNQSPQQPYLGKASLLRPDR